MTVNNSIDSKQNLGSNSTPSFTGLNLGGPYSNSGQPAFYAYSDSVINNVTGDGTDYTVIFNTEFFDQANNYDGNTTFTAGQTAIYHFDVCIKLGQLTALYTSGFVSLIVTSGGTNQVLRLFDGNPGVIRDISGNLVLIGSVTTRLVANDTVTVQLTISGSTKDIDLSGSAINIGNQSSFSGFLIC